MQALRKYEPLIEALVELFHPWVEVAVHDLKTGKVVRLYNTISKRKVGDSSPLQELKINTEKFPDFFPPYYKENWDGKPLKCTSITLRDEKANPVGLICINFDTSLFQNFQTQLDLFLKLRVQSENPVESFSENWKDTITFSIQNYLKSEKLSLDHLSRDEKRNLVKHLYQQGVFNFKNAHAFVAKSLRISRASIYNYLE